jgi:uncharacterized iron-regulated protein
MRLLRFLSALLLACLPVAPAAAAPPLPSWESPLLAEHLLVGRIYRAGSAEPLTPDKLAAELATAAFVLLGEKHDNPDHHRLQGWVVAALASAGRRPAVVWEMITQEQAPALAAYLAQPGRDAGGLGPAIAWEKTGWPAWPLYQPIAVASLAGGLTIAAGDLDTATKRSIGRQGLDTLPAEWRQARGLDVAYSADDAASLQRELVDSHCGMLPTAALGRMSDVQRSRDAEMARRMIEAGSVDGAVLIAGGGHVRRDRAVPWHLARLAPGRAVATLGFVETIRGQDDPRLYARDSANAPPLYDFIWLTPRVDENDPCAAHREQLERLRQRP